MSASFVIKNCLTCEKEFKAKPYDLKIGKGKNCSRSCYYKYRSKELFDTPIERFFKKISNENHPLGCWIWDGGKGTNQYGNFHSDKTKKNMRAHRYSWELHFGEIPKGFFICHSCDTKLCVNPDHLFVGSPLDNMQDMINKNRQVTVKGSQNGQAKLTEADVEVIKEKLKLGYLGKDLAIEYGVDMTVISKIKLNKTWRHV